MRISSANSRMNLSPSFPHNNGILPGSVHHLRSPSNRRTFGQIVGRIYEEERIANQNATRIEEALKKLIEFLFALFIFHILVLLANESYLSYWIAFIPLIGFFIINIFLQLSKKRTIQYFHSSNRITLIKSICEDLIFLIFLGLVMFQCIEDGHLFNMVLVMPLIIGFVAKIFIPSIKWEFRNIYLALGNIGRFLFILQTFLICLKLDKIISWSWSGVFSPFWCCYVIFLILSLAFLLFCCWTVCAYYLQNMQSKDFVATLWLSGGVIGFSIFSVLLLIQIINVVEGEKSKMSNSIMALPCVYYGIMGLFTMFAFNNIHLREYWVSKIGNISWETNSYGRSNPFSQSTNSTSLNPSQPPQNTTIPTPPPMINKPSFMIKLSDTYFQSLDKWKPSFLYQKQYPIKSINNSPSNENFPQQVPLNSSINLPGMPYSQIQKKCNSHRIKKQSTQALPNDQNHKTTEENPNKRCVTEFDTKNTLVSSTKNDDFTKGLCSICFSQEANGVIMNCGHSGICFHCAKYLLKTTQICHFCRSNIRKLIKFWK